MNSSAINEVLDAQIAAFDARQGERMIEALCAFLHRFVAYPSVQAEIAHALWIVHCHMMDSWDSTPRLAFLSAEPASGKTRALEVTELLVPNPVATVNVTPAYLFRKVGSEGGATILFDEIDTVFGPRAKDNEDIRGLLNAGHRRGAMTGRCAYRGKEVALEELPAYAAVAMAGIGWLPGTVLSRSVVIRMRRRHAGERVEGFRRRIHEIEGWNLRDQISVWAEAAAADVKWPDLPPEIADRDADVWEPLLAVADLIGGEWPQRARAAAVALVAQSKEVEPSLGIRLLTDLKVVFADAEAISSKSVLQALHMLLEAPWSDLQGKPLDERRLAYRLKQYGVGPKTIRVGASTCRGYARADLVDLWARYLPPTSETSETSETGELNGSNRDPARQLKGQSTAVSDVSDVSLPGEVGRQCSHCQRTGGELCEASVGGSTIWLHRACMEVFRI
jgi:hypothetical protein